MFNFQRPAEGCRMRMFKFYIVLIVLFYFHTFTLCISLCEKGFYGPGCNKTCSPNCRQSMCKVSNIGTGECTRGCKPGFFGSRCEVRCRKPSVNQTCQECPTECRDGFCDLGKICMSGCLNGYYGYNCTCDRTVGCHPGCGKDCEGPETSALAVYYYIAGGVGVLVLVSILGLVIYLSHRMKRVDQLLSRRVELSRGNELGAAEPQVTVSTPCTASLSDSLYTAVTKELRREVIPVRTGREKMDDFIDAYNAVSEYDDEVGTYNKLMWNAYR